MADKQRSQELQAAFAIHRVLKRHKQPHETEYKKELRRTGKGYKIQEAFYVAVFINGVGKQELSHLLKESNPKDLDTAAKEAILLERSDGADPPLLGEKENKRPRAPSPAAARHDHELPPKRPRQDSRRCYQCQQFGHIARDCSHRQRWDRR
ncbi:hypothetical protein P3T76_014607 [Phytophthora citrophthora]|uniref:CCHC-type domain-containing protein n=1 Tax=Phytophthora citrophthora TaxID=4793 RepID=A0AAD9LBY4_9STRA|nr:hypothetical protein P3T76_014607 [Phytophthora citrophthora]